MPELSQAPAEGLRYGLKEFPTSSHSVLLEIAGEGRGRRLLDVGAADGFLSERLKSRGWRVTAIESDPRWAQAARSHCERVIVADLNREIPPVEGLFDAILYGDVLEHLADPETVFRSLNRFLARDGFLLVSVPNVAHLWVRLGLLFGRFHYTERGLLDRTHLRFFTRKSFRHFLEQGGVKLCRVVSLPAPLELVVPQRWRGKWLAVLQKGHALAAQVWPGGLAYQFVAKGEVL